jgi:antitoxin HicB
MFDYPVTLEKDSNGSILANFPDVPEAHTFGADAEEALLRAVDALETALAMYVDDGKDLPKPSRPKRSQRTARPSALPAIKLAIYQSMRDQGIRKAELARRLGWHLPQVDRLLDLQHASRLDQVEAAIAALGRRLDVQVTA